ncbi:hypothetical protein AGMMS4952_06920 [Spirochaetia bacterium]|nr:hypothetical protein AGMMS4952_06920 [Spirochaetia bacterium]
MKSKLTGGSRKKIVVLVLATMGMILYCVFFVVVFIKSEMHLIGKIAGIIATVTLTLTPVTLLADRIKWSLFDKKEERRK